LKLLVRHGANHLPSLATGDTFAMVPRMRGRRLANRNRSDERRLRRRARMAPVEPWPYRRVTSRQGPGEAPPPAASRSPRQSLKLAVLVFVQYALVASDIRFVSRGDYVGIAIVNVCIALNTWYLTRGIIEARTSIDRWCFVIGGTSGALTAVLLT
jgi:hypothetical protein